MIPSMALQATFKGGSGGGGGTLDTQTITSGGAGGIPDRLRGFESGVMGSISDGTSNIYSGAAITIFEWSEEGGGGSQKYFLEITGATNSGWTSVTLTGGATEITLNRASATFSAGRWTWSSSETVSTSAFSPSGSTVTAAFN